MFGFSFVCTHHDHRCLVDHTSALDFVLRKKKLKTDKFFTGKPSQNYTALLADAAWHKWGHLALTPASKAGTRFTYPEGWKAELT